MNEEVPRKKEEIMKRVPSISNDHPEGAPKNT
jgi:hypothetical protein